MVNITNNKTAAHEWAVAVFGARESLEVLESTLVAAISACQNRTSVIDVLINGNRTLAEQICARASEFCLPENVSIKLWFFSAADKATTWNDYIHNHWPDSHYTFFIDGYAAVRPNAFRELANALSNAPQASCATGTPSEGLSAKKLREQMLKHHGIHGNLYALPNRIIRALRSMHFRLPQGIYRTDSALASALAFSLDPENNEWTPSNLLVVETATWKVPPPKWWTVGWVRSHWSRRFRQAQGDFENKAIRQHLAFDKRSPAALPETVIELLDSWLSGHRSDALKLAKKSFRHRLTFKAMERDDLKKIQGGSGQILKTLP